MTEITPGIYWLRLPTTMPQFNVEEVNAYLVEGDSGYLLVDAGWNTDYTLDSLQKQLAEIGITVGDISRIVITHVHPDHYGLAGRLKQMSGASLAFHEIEKGFIASRYVNMDALLEQTATWLGVNGVPPDELAGIRDATLGLEQYIVPTQPDVALHGGEEISTGKFTFKVLWTPGHSRGHICLYEPDKRVLISGDHILPTITPNIGKHPQSGENTLGNYLDSLKDIRKLDIGLVLPGHETPFDKLRPRLDELIRHHQARNREILAAVKAHPKTAYQIATEITWRVTGNWQSMPPPHQRLAISETLSHLELMTINGRVDMLSRDGVVYYQLK